MKKINKNPLLLTVNLGIFYLIKRPKLRLRLGKVTAKLRISRNRRIGYSCMFEGNIFSGYGSYGIFPDRVSLYTKK